MGVLWNIFVISTSFSFHTEFFRVKRFSVCLFLSFSQAHEEIGPGETECSQLYLLIRVVQSTFFTKEFIHRINYPIKRNFPALKYQTSLIVFLSRHYNVWHRKKRNNQQGFLGPQLMPSSPIPALIRFLWRNQASKQT